MNSQESCSTQENFFFFFGRLEPLFSKICFRFSHLCLVKLLSLVQKKISIAKPRMAIKTWQESPLSRTNKKTLSLHVSSAAILNFFFFLKRNPWNNFQVLLKPVNLSVGRMTPLQTVKKIDVMQLVLPCGFGSWIALAPLNGRSTSHSLRNS